MRHPDLTALLVSWNAAHDLPAALASVEGVAEAIVVDNASDDGSAEVARRHGARVIANRDNRGFASAANQGLRETHTPLVLLLNPDAELRPGALDALRRTLDSIPRAAVVGPRTRNPDGTIQVSFGRDLTPASERRQRRLVLGVERRDPAILREVEDMASRPRTPDWISGSCWLARRAALETVGLFDEGYFLYEEDADLCRRLRAAGWELAFTPDAEVVHRKGTSADRAGALARREYDRSHLRYYRKFNGRLATLLLRLSLALRGR
ncbi:MAG TPA: glycosyltransferase family 2 protein [Vicinamibacteria bacterium]|nr:glycosyltransferase family 2 protein [Vicinamibacteria bacterium]